MSELLTALFRGHLSSCQPGWRDTFMTPPRLQTRIDSCPYGCYVERTPECYDSARQHKFPELGRALTALKTHITLRNYICRVFLSSVRASPPSARLSWSAHILLRWVRLHCKSAQGHSRMTCKQGYVQRINFLDIYAASIRSAAALCFIIYRRCKITAAAITVLSKTNSLLCQQRQTDNIHECHTAL